MNQNNDINCPEMDYYMNEDLCDVVFEVNGQRIPAFSPLLSVKSRVFRDIFAVKVEETEDNVIVIEDTTVDAFKAFIRFIICEQLVFSDDNDINLILEVLQLSDKYQVHRLTNKIIEFIIPRVNLQNLRSVTKIAFKYLSEQLMTIINEFIVNNINEVIHLDIEELSQINDCTNDRLFDVMTSYRVTNDGQLINFGVKDSPESPPRHLYVKSLDIIKNHFPFSRYSSETHINGSFEAFKVLIGFLYFNRLIIKDKNDFKLIEEVYGMAERYTIDGLKNVISADLQIEITFENIRQLLKLISDFEIKDLKERVYEFIGINLKLLVKRDVEELTSNKNTDLELIRDILNANQKSKVSVDLKERMAVLLENWITFDNLLIIYKIAVDYSIEDLKTNIKTFIDENMSQLSVKEMHELIELNNALNNTLFEVMAKQVFNKQRVGPKRRRRTNIKYKDFY